MTRHARHLLRMRRMKRARRRFPWFDRIKSYFVGVDMGSSDYQSVTLVYRNGKWRRV